MAQPDGFYPRLNSEQLQSGNFDGMICSFVGKIRNHDAAQQIVSLECSDGGVMQLDASQAELPESIMNFGNGGGDDQQPPIVEAIGQVVDPSTITLFITRELTVDTNMAVYNKMLAVQHNPKFACYFSPYTGGQDAPMGQ